MQEKLRCIVLDDLPDVSKFIEKCTLDSALVEITACFTNPVDFLSAEQKLTYDIILLDISMPQMDGFQVARALNGKPVIFMTVFPDLLKTATEFAPVDLITKPFDKERLLKGLEKAYKLLKGNVAPVNEFELFGVEGDAGQVKIQTKDIVFAKVDEVERRHKNIVLKNGEKYKLLYCDFDRLLKSSNRLVQVNKSELISLDVLHSIDKDLITLTIIGDSGKRKEITLSRTYKQALTNRLNLR